MQAGESLGPYEIVELLGAGGMGEVWLALDPRLGRKVAIKVLPAEFAADPERRARFEQEARAAAALNHPNIAVVHDIGADGDTHFMVQEHLEGSTLRDRMAAGPLPLQESLALGGEIAEALVAAHTAGIVHRDLKPENVFVTLKGHAKVLDFGLAKLLEPGGTAGGDATMSPTMVGTMAGAVMGTAGYMAPEQIQGQKIDRRVDLFAFGCVLYEMLTGERAFAGRTLHQTLDLVLSDAPGGDVGGDQHLPGPLRWVLDKCLSKDPARRYQDADDLVVDMARLGEAAVAGSLEGTTPARRASVPETRSRAWLPWLLTGVVAAALAAVVAAVAWGGIGGAAGVIPAVRFVIPVPGALPNIELMHGASVAVAPDGSAVVMRGRDQQGTVQLWRRPIDSLQIEPIPGTAGAGTVAFSPDSRALAYNAGGEIYIVELEAGVATAVGTVGTNVRGIDWGPDEWIVVGHSDEFGSTLGLHRVNLDGGEAQVLVEPSGNDSTSYRFPTFLPGGREILFTIEDPSLGASTEKNLAVYSLDTDTIDILPVRGTHARWATSGHLLFARRGDLVAVPFDIASRRVLGPESVIAQQIHVHGDRGEAQLAVSPAGVLAYGLAENEQRGLTHVDRDGTATPLPGQDRAYGGVQLSPDGRQLSVTVATEGATDIWIYELGQQTIQRFTVDGVSSMAQWSADGESLVYLTYAGDGVWSTVRSPLESAGTQEVVKFGGASIAERSLQLHPDDDGTAVFARFGDIWVAPAEGQPRALFETPAMENWPTFSPDGDWIAYLSQESGRDLIYVTRFPGPGRRWLVSELGGAEPVWSRDGRELFFTRGNSMMAASFDPQREPPFGETVELFSDPRLVFASSEEPTYVATPDGTFIIYLRPAEQAPREIQVLTGLDAELDRLAPARARDEE